MVTSTPVPDALNRWQSLPATLRPADAVVVLGAAGLDPDWELSGSSVRRAQHGISLYREGWAPLLVMSGFGGEAEARAALAQASGIPANAIFTEDTARTTREEALRLGALLRPRGVRTVLLVVDAQGTRRASAVFRAAGFEVRPAPTEDVPSTPDGPAERLQLTRRVLMEAIAYAYYAVAGYL